MLIKITFSLFIAGFVVQTSGFHVGTNAVPGQFPSSVSIQTPATELTHCNGVILNANHILTAAQCVFNSTNHLLHPFWFRVIAGDLNVMVPSYRRFTTTVSHIYPHPDYNPQTLANDIAVLRLQNSFNFPHNTIDAIERNQRIVPVGEACSVAGWGAPNNNAAALTPLQQFIRIPILDRTACNAANAHAGRVQENMVCAGQLPGGGNNNPSACRGNLGAGLYCNDQLTGILTFGLGCAVQNRPPVFMQVRFFNNWIQQQFARRDVVRAGTVAGRR